RTNLRDYKAIFFDAGDTLLTIPASHEIMQAYLRERQLQVDGQNLERVLNEAMTHYYYNKKTYSDEAVTAQSDRDFWIEVYRFVLDRLEAGKVWSLDQIQACCHELYDVFVSPDYYTLFDDVRDTLER